MTAVLDRFPVEEITTRAREVRFGRSLLAMVGAVLYGIGWAVAKVFGVLWLAVTWCALAVRVGWDEARGKKPSNGEGG